jgi:light-regulated signal transduction histidine kinase (bacteriophytochrome)
VAHTINTVDLTNCDREPIHLLGAIQPIGFLIAVSTDWIVARTSANIGSFTGHKPGAIIGNPLADFLPGQLIHDLRNRVAYLVAPDMVERLFACRLAEGGQPFDVAIHLSHGQIIIEFEPGAESIGDASGTVRAMMARLDTKQDLLSFYREGARQVRGLLGYDRVMMVQARSWPRRASLASARSWGCTIPQATFPSRRGRSTSATSCA